MGWFNLFKNINSAEGAREAMRLSYKKHLDLARQGKIPSAHNPCHTGLYGALGSRYKMRGMPVTEIVLWSELVPFLLMKETEATEALAEYVVYQEKPEEANISWLKKLINTALRVAPSSEELLRSTASLGFLDQVAWCNLLDIDVKNRLEKESEEILKTQDYFNKGGALGDLGRHDEALEMFDKAIEINPQFDKAYYNKGLALGNLGRCEEAIEMFDKTIEINPQDAKAYYNKGVILGKLGRHEEAIEMFDNAIEIDPQNVSAYLNKGSALGDLGRQEEAIAIYDKAIEINPQDADVYYNKGVALGDLGRYKEAIEMFDKAIEIDPLDAGAYYNKGVALTKMGHDKEAAEMIKKGKEIDPR